MLMYSHLRQWPTVCPTLPRRGSGNVSPLSCRHVFSDLFSQQSGMLKIPRSPSSSLLSLCRARKREQQSEKGFIQGRHWCLKGALDVIDLYFLLLLWFRALQHAVYENTRHCLHVVIKNVSCLPIVVEMCLVFSVLAYWGQTQWSFERSGQKA